MRARTRLSRCASVLTFRPNLRPTSLTFSTRTNDSVSRLQIWDLKTNKIKTDLPGHTDEVYCVDWVADKVVSGGRDKTVKMCVLIFSSF